MSAQPQPRLTPEEYLALDRAAEFRSEYDDGHMYAMSGGSYWHARITANLSGWLWQALKGKPCVVTSNDLRVRVTPRTYAYPDIIVICGPEQLADDQKDVLLNPALLVEVLSPSTEAHDRGLKFGRYQELVSLQEYVLVTQAEPRVEVLRRQPDGKWLYSDFRGVNSTCRLETLDCSIPLSEIYYQVSFDPHP